MTRAKEVVELCTEHFHGWFLSDDVLGVCEQLLDPGEVVVDGRACERGSLREWIAKRRGRTRATDHDAVVMYPFGEVGHVINDVETIKGEGRVYAHGWSDIIAKWWQKALTPSDLCKRLGQELVVYLVVVDVFDRVVR